MSWAEAGPGLVLVMALALCLSCAQTQAARSALVRRPVVITYNAERRLEIADDIHRLVADSPASLGRVIEHLERDRQIEVRYAIPPPQGFSRRLGQALIDAGFTAVSIPPEPRQRRR